LVFGLICILQHPPDFGASSCTTGHVGYYFFFGLGFGVGFGFFGEGIPFG